MAAHRRTWFDARGLSVASASASAGDGARSIPFYCGAMHYWRVAPERWASCLRAMHDLGLTLVETYVPWRVHAPRPGVQEWHGTKDLSRFLDAARAAGLHVVLRPGPHVNAELTSFGMPDWVLAEPACQARTGRGTPAWMPSPPRAWPIPSYASRAFQAHVQAWYAAVAAIVRPHLAPDGPVVAIGVDNEAQVFFRLGAYDLDYHPDALEWWAEDADAHGEAPIAWTPERAAACAAWVRFKDRYIARALGDFARMLDEVGLGEVGIFHNLPPGPSGLYDLRGIQAAINGPVGIDAYTGRADFPALRRRGLACVGSAQPIPIGFEVGVGFFPWIPPLDPGDDATRERDHLLVLLAAGLRGFNLFMAVERDRYYGAAIDKTGRVEAHAAWVKPLLAALAEVDWPALRRRPMIALVACKADARFGLASSWIDPMTPVVAELLELGPGGAAELGRDPGAIAARRWHDAVARALELAQVPYVIVDEATPLAELATYRAVVAPTQERVDHALWGTLRALAEARTVRVVIGPGTPTRDELDRPLAEAAPTRGLGRLAVASLADVVGLADDLAGLAGPASDAWQIERPDDVRAYVYSEEAGAARVVFVVSDAERATTAVLLADDHTLRDVFSQELVRIVGGRASIALPPRGVRMFVVLPGL